MVPLQLRTLSNVDRLQYNVSVPYPKLGLAENTSNIELGAAPLVQYYSVFSAGSSLRYGTLIAHTLHTTCLQCILQMYHFTLQTSKIFLCWSQDLHGKMYPDVCLSNYEFFLILKVLPCLAKVMRLVCETCKGASLKMSNSNNYSFRG